jgi:hypothetical protein
MRIFSRTLVVLFFWIAQISPLFTYSQTFPQWGNLQPGPYAVGYRAIRLIDSARTYTIRKLTLMYLLAAVITSHAQHLSHEMLKPLEVLLGDWNVDANMRLSKTGPWEKTKATSHFKKSVGESIFEEEYAGTKEGRVFTFRTWLANDNRSKRYQRVSVDSDHGVLVLYEGLLQNDTLTLLTQMQMPQYTLHLRVQYLFISNDKFMAESSRSTDGAKTWDTTSQLTYHRAK